MNRQLTKSDALLLLIYVEQQFKDLGAAAQLVQLSTLKITYRISTLQDIAPIMRKLFGREEVHVVHLANEAAGVYFLSLILDPDFDLIDPGEIA